MSTFKYYDQALGEWVALPLPAGRPGPAGPQGPAAVARQETAPEDLTVIWVDPSEPPADSSDGIWTYGGMYLGSDGIKSTNPLSGFYMVPVYLRDAVSIDGMAVCVEIAYEAGWTASIGIYDHTKAYNGPKNLILNAGIVSLDTSGTKTASLAETVTLPKGMYWFTANIEGVGASPPLMHSLRRVKTGINGGASPPRNYVHTTSNVYDYAGLVGSSVTGLPTSMPPVGISSQVLDVTVVLA